MSYSAHQKAGEEIVARCAIVTLSDTRTQETDKSGQLIRQLLEAAKHAVTRYAIIADEPAKLGSLLEEHLAAADVDLIITNGGTGISPRDQTIATIERLIDTPLPGFGELFRSLSFAQIGSGAMLSRAVGVIARGKPMFALPGSTKAVELGMTKLILPEIGHVLAELRKGKT